jgi:hypothetical protein
MSWGMTTSLFDALHQIFTGKVGANDLSGPVGMVSLVHQTSDRGPYFFLYLLSFVSLNLAIFNMLPFPALDGGRILFVIIRLITGKAITDRMEAVVHTAGMILLLLLMVFVTQNDILSGGKNINQLKVLMNHTDTIFECILGGGNGSGLSVYQDFTLVRVINTRQHIHQRCFAAAVFTQQRQNFTTMNVQRNIAVGNDFITKSFRDVFQLNRCNSFHEDHPSCRPRHVMGKHRS